MAAVAANLTPFYGDNYYKQPISVIREQLDPE